VQCAKNEILESLADVSSEGKRHAHGGGRRFED
jgi:hypothetical protein